VQTELVSRTFLAEAALYAPVGAVKHETVRALSPQRLMLWCALWMVMAFVAFAAVALAVEYARRSRESLHS
jgi:hypothetical protein